VDGELPTGGAGFEPGNGTEVFDDASKHEPVIPR